MENTNTVNTDGWMSVKEVMERYANQQDPENPKQISRVPDPKDPARPRIATQVPSAPEPSPAVVEIIARAKEEAPAPVVATEGQLHKHLRETDEWQAKIDQIDRERGGAVFSDRQVQENPALIRRVAYPQDPQRPVMPEWVPLSERPDEIVQERGTAQREQRGAMRYLHQDKGVEAVFDLPQAVGNEVVVHPVRKLTLVQRAKVERAPAPTAAPAQEKDMKLEGPIMAQNQVDTSEQGPKQSGPGLKRRPRQSL
ncbi:hypothetical protein MJ547_04175, partial [Burkholderia gladioli]